MTPKKTRASEEAELEEFAMSSHAYGRLTGASMACHAVPDAFFVLHTGVGCKYKGAGQYTLHDRARASHHREAYTEVTDMALIKGSADRVGVYVRNWYGHRKPAFMAVGTATFLEMAGEDIGGAVKEAAKTVPCPVAYVPAIGFEGDLYEGYSAVALEVLKRAPFKKTKAKRGRVGIVGYPFDRYEMDHAGNLQQLRHLLDSIGLEPGPVLLSGQPFKTLMGIASCDRIVALPFARHYAKDLAALTGRPVLETGLPVGPSATFRWLRDVGRFCRAGRPAIDSAIEGLKTYSRPQLDMFRSHAREHLGARRAAVFAATPLAAGLVSTLLDLGISPVLVGLRDRSLGGRAAFADAVDRAGHALPKDLEVLECPSLQAVKRKIDDLRCRDRIGLMAATHTEIHAAKGDERSLPFPALEIGFPSFTHHVLYPEPFLGVGGALALAHRIYDILH